MNSLELRVVLSLSVHLWFLFDLHYPVSHYKKTKHFGALMWVHIINGYVFCATACTFEGIFFFEFIRNPIMWSSLFTFYNINGWQEFEISHFYECLLNVVSLIVYLRGIGITTPLYPLSLYMFIGDYPGSLFFSKTLCLIIFRATHTAPLSVYL